MLNQLRGLHKDHYGGALTCVLGLATVFKGTEYQFGSLNRMGPGFFPVTLGVMLTLTGIGIAAKPKSNVAFVFKGCHVDWRGWGGIILSLCAFIILGKYGGLVLATFSVVFIAALADRDNSLISAAALALLAVIICVVVFWWFLKMQLPLFK